MFTVDRLLRASRGENPAAGMEHPLEHLVACHGRIEERLQILERSAAHLDTNPGEAMEAALGCFRYLETSGVLHTRDEEESIFPRLRPKLAAEQKAHLDVLEQQHRDADHLAAHMKELLQAVNEAAGSGKQAEFVREYRHIVEGFCDHYRHHISFENTELIELGRRTLDGAELSAISAEMKGRRGLPAAAAPTEK